MRTTLIDATSGQLYRDACRNYYVCNHLKGEAITPHTPCPRIPSLLVQVTSAHHPYNEKCARNYIFISTRSLSSLLPHSSFCFDALLWRLLTVKRICKGFFLSIFDTEKRRRSEDHGAMVYDPFDIFFDSVYSLVFGGRVPWKCIDCAFEFWTINRINSCTLIFSPSTDGFNSLKAGSRHRSLIL